jgi:hypothetical protein
MRLFAGRLICTQCNQCEHTPYGECPPCLPPEIHQAGIEQSEAQRQICEEWKNSELGKRLQGELDEARDRYNKAKMEFIGPTYDRAMDEYQKVLKEHWKEE